EATPTLTSDPTTGLSEVNCKIVVSNISGNAAQNVIVDAVVKCDDNPGVILQPIAGTFAPPGVWTNMTTLPFKANLGSLDANQSQELDFKMAITIPFESAGTVKLIADVTSDTTDR